jgi:tetratricopeptide (TPR) repeat protein
MRASIYEMTNNYDKALADLNEAYSIDPTSYSVIYRKANAEYSLKQYDNAKADYQRMLNINPRSIEAHIGLSRIAVIEKNLGQANEYADNAVALSPSDPEVYIRRASVRKMMGNNTGAVDDLILALSTGKDNPKVLHELVEMGNADYSAVITGLSNAIRQAPKVGMYYYIRGIIAEAHFNYVSALDDFKKIANENLFFFVFFLVKRPYKANALPAVNYCHQIVVFRIDAAWKHIANLR